MRTPQAEARQRLRTARLFQHPDRVRGGKFLRHHFLFRDVPVGLH